MRHSILRVPTQGLVAPWLVLLALFVTFPAGAKDRGTKFDREADFSKYKLYDWEAENRRQPEGTPLALGGAADTEIRDAIDQRLRAQGFEAAIDEPADFLVAYDGTLEPVTDIEGQRRDLGTGVAWVIEGSISSYNRGTLVITIKDRETGNVVWTGWTTETIKDPNNPGKQINRAVKKLLRQFPPRQ